MSLISAASYPGSAGATSDCSNVNWSNSLLNVQSELWLTPTLSTNTTFTGDGGISVFSQTLNGTAGTDMIFGLGGRNTINGNAGSDLLCGGNGNDTLNGGDGNDVIDGENGSDTLNVSTTRMALASGSCV